MHEGCGNLKRLGGAEAQRCSKQNIIRESERVETGLGRQYEGKQTA